MVWASNSRPLSSSRHKEFVWGPTSPRLYSANVVGSSIMVYDGADLSRPFAALPFAAIARDRGLVRDRPPSRIPESGCRHMVLMIYRPVWASLKKIGIKMAPLTLAIVLGEGAEDSARLR